MSTSTQPSLRVCIHIEAGQYVAQCVDFDISATGTSVESALDAFVHGYIKQVLAALEVGAEPFSNMAPAPAEYLDKWRRDAQRGHKVKTRRIPGFKMVKQGRPIPAEFFGTVEACVPFHSAA